MAISIQKGHIFILYTLTSFLGNDPSVFDKCKRRQKTKKNTSVTDHNNKTQWSETQCKSYKKALIRYNTALFYFICSHGFELKTSAINHAGV